MDNEKKIKLEELPDKGSEPDKIVFTPVAKSKPEPRLEKLKTLNNAEKIEAIGQTWFFDKQIKRWAWLYVLLLLLVLEKSGHMSAFDKKRKQYRAEGDKASEMVLDMFSFEGYENGGKEEGAGNWWLRGTLLNTTTASITNWSYRMPRPGDFAESSKVTVGAAGQFWIVRAGADNQTLMPNQGTYIELRFTK